MARILIDSSVWIEYYRLGSPPAVRDAVRGILASDLCVTTGLIVVEVLQGAKSESVFAQLKQDFSALPWLDLPRDRRGGAGSCLSTLASGCAF
jgi:predicted nucleic acid-binding protein